MLFSLAGIIRGALLRTIVRRIRDGDLTSDSGKVRLHGRQAKGYERSLQDKRFGQKKADMEGFAFR